MWSIQYYYPTVSMVNFVNITEQNKSWQTRGVIRGA